MREEMKYPIAETFYSLKGEGIWSGTPMFFIRLSGCNLHCDFCDTKYSLEKPSRMATITELLEEADKTGTDRVVITGGEPLIHEVKPLTDALNNAGYTIHVESNGTMECPPGVHWLTVSPKSAIETLNEYAAYQADEIKFLVGRMDDEVEEKYGGWKQYIDAFLQRFPDVNARLLVMPIANTSSRDINALEWDNTRVAIEYALEHPNFTLTLQIHKILYIR